MRDALQAGSSPHYSAGARSPCKSAVDTLSWAPVLSAVRARRQQIEDGEPHASKRPAAHTHVCMEPGGGSAIMRTTVPAILLFPLHPSELACSRVAVKTLTL
jgi:hypothetical protein